MWPKSTSRWLRKNRREFQTEYLDLAWMAFDFLVRFGKLCIKSRCKVANTPISIFWKSGTIARTMTHLLSLKNDLRLRRFNGYSDYRSDLWNILIIDDKLCHRIIEFYFIWDRINVILRCKQQVHPFCTW